MASFTAQINYLGTPLSKKDLVAVRAGENNQTTQIDVSILGSFFGLNIQHLPEEVLDRYVEISPPEMYYPIIPHTELLIGRLFGPLKSAKRCYCLGEYLATMELASHVAEMLTTLIWEITPVSYNGQAIEKKFEENVLGSKFEKLGQKRRLEVLRGLKLLPEKQFEQFSFLRTTRSKYFHHWSEDISKIKKDALQSYLKIMTLIKEILQIGISKEQPGTVSMNPLLLKYMETHGVATSNSL